MGFKLFTQEDVDICKKLDDSFGEFLQTKEIAVEASCHLTFSDSLTDLNSDPSLQFKIKDVKIVSKTDKRYAGLPIYFSFRNMQRFLEDQEYAKRYLTIIKQTIMLEALKYYEYDSFEMSFKREDGTYFKLSEPFNPPDLFCVITRK